MRARGQASSGVVAGGGDGSVNTAGRVAVVAMFSVVTLISVLFTVTQTLASPKLVEAVVATSSDAVSLIARACRAIRTTQTRGG